jgi:hypothetical protein
MERKRATPGMAWRAWVYLSTYPRQFIFCKKA